MSISVPEREGSKLRSHCFFSWQSKIRYVDRSAIVEWDIIASNGIIHIISEPLKAPSEPVSAYDSGFWGGERYLSYFTLNSLLTFLYSHFPWHICSFQLKRLLSKRIRS